MADVTLERLEVFEERAGVDLRGLFVEHTRFDNNDSQWVEVKGELFSRDGNVLNADIVLEVAVYDVDGRVLAVASDSIDSDTFFGFEIFSITTQFPSSVTPAKARVYPKIR